MPKTRIFRIPPSVSKSFKNVSHLKMEEAISYTMPSPLINSSVQSELEDTIITNVDSRSLLRVRLTDDLTRETCILHLIEDNHNQVLVNQKQRVIGVYRDWTESNVPEYWKNKDGIIVDPDNGGELMEFTLFPDKSNNSNNSRTYREYNYLADHDTLQQTHEVEILD
jgi:hypothetical protein